MAGTRITLISQTDTEFFLSMGCPHNPGPNFFLAYLATLAGND